MICSQKILFNYFLKIRISQTSFATWRKWSTPTISRLLSSIKTLRKNRVSPAFNIQATILQSAAEVSHTLVPSNLDSCRCNSGSERRTILRKLLNWTFSKTLKSSRTLAIGKNTFENQLWNQLLKNWNKKWSLMINF